MQTMIQRDQVEMPVGGVGVSQWISDTVQPGCKLTTLTFQGMLVV